VLVAAPYPDRIIQKAIRMLKYHFARELAGELSKLLVRELEAAVELDRGWTGFNAIVPVPLHVARLKYRGFNQSEALGQGVSRRFGWPLRSELLVRHRFTPPQAKLEETQRRKNLQKAFIVPDTAVVAGLRLLLIDDVTTTGTTLKAAAEALKEAGATEIRAVVLASG